jgi:hypothetical protein
MRVINREDRLKHFHRTRHAINAEVPMKKDHFMQDHSTLVQMLKNVVNHEWGTPGVLRTLMFSHACDLC